MVTEKEVLYMKVLTRHGLVTEEEYKKIVDSAAELAKLRGVLDLSGRALQRYKLHQIEVEMGGIRCWMRR
jgi:hypothetical protein